MLEAAPREYEDIRIAVPWGHIAGRWYGNRNLRPILAIHGWLDNLGTWDTLIPLLPQHIGILCVDLPGHGHSSNYPKGMQYHGIDFIDVIMRVIMEYKWPKVSLLAHSLGSIVSFIYTALFPDMVDMLIAIDIIKPAYNTEKEEINQLRVNAEKMLLEDERSNKLAMYEPPSYTYDQLERVLFEGSQRSVDIDKCKHLLDRNIAKSRKFPEKYYFSRDSRLKYYNRLITWPALDLELARRIKNVPYMVIKATKSNYMGEDSKEIIEILRQNNPHFEYHEIDGTHHVHLNNARECATVINPFINAHRPAMPDTWTVDDEEETAVKTSKSRNRRKNAAKRHFKWLRSKL
ncbi:probable serine hydrolase [Anastrepha obliqua]|uniref:probable serine hydrolase n=1 Tax=Anastrepha obliqua TaxID=95512 RepID=UPI00240A4534|nr:probable serine hydrolase [Anastrepha obliqua]